MVKGLIRDIFDMFEGRPQEIGATYLSAALNTVSFIHNFVQVVDLRDRSGFKDSSSSHLRRSRESFQSTQVTLHHHCLEIMAIIVYLKLVLLVFDLKFIVPIQFF